MTVDKQVKQTIVGGRWRLVSMVLGLVSLGLLIAVIVMAFKQNGSIEGGNTDTSSKPDTREYKMCDSGSGHSKIDTSESEFPGMYDDLTMKELKAIQEYMYGVPDLNIVKPSQATVKHSYIFVSDLQPPNKTEALAYLAGVGPRPERTARLLVFRGDASPPVVGEYLVGTLPAPTWHKLYTNSVRKNPVPYAYRPVGFVEFGAIANRIFSRVDEEIGYILTESYGARFTNCGDKCLTIYPAPVGTAIMKDTVRKIWFKAYHFAEYYSVNPLDFHLLINLNSNDPKNYYIEKIFYSDEQYSNLAELALKYNTTNIPKTKVPFPEKETSITSMHQRGEPVPTEPKRAPRMLEPDGKRYTVDHRRVEYMQWKFNFRLSTLMGPQIYDVRFNGERIAYEVGLQEIAVFYSANNSATRSADFLDSGALIGTHSQALVPGSDCPETSTFVDVSYIGEHNEDDPVFLKRAMCLFELNTGVPLRRHLSFTRGEGGFYSGVSDNVFIVRSIMTIVNYDYVIDFIFHQSGALEVRALSTGYIFTSFLTPEEHPYGFNLHNNIIGNIHFHMFLFKADVDIHGTSNRYETLDISTEEVLNEETTGDPRSSYAQIKFDRHLKINESEAKYKFNFDHPKYHIIHNNDRKTEIGEIKAYRLHMTGMAKQLLPEEKGNEALVSWSRNQLTVTRHKEEEVYASSSYGLFDSLDPTVNFTSFYADDEDLVDEDLVMWVSMGTHHIPHTEDLPVTPTAGGHLGFILLPYNYFKECPTSQSRDSVRIRYKNLKRPEEGVMLDRNGLSENSECIVHAQDLDKYVKEHPEWVLQKP